MCPFGYAKAHSPARVNPALRQTASEAGCSTEGKACSEG